ncbi:oxidoreductase [Bacillus tuaregi]|uniref:oxidoreductase n=1 Tax=Bacillus tuaregi TaxID=1816695 RepID=UPI0008F86009|nr:FAD-dependent oxidoreductase [Bacillus tuaregi]
MKYQHLFAKGKIGSLTLKNRIVMPPMGTNLSGPDGEITDHMIAYYEERAKGGTGLVIVEVASIDYEYGKAAVTQPRVDEDRFIPGIHRLVNAVHKHGAKIFMQLHHAGRESKSILIGGKQIVAPSPVTCPSIGEEPRELTTAEVKELVMKFVMGAVRAKLAGADGVEIHAAHGYLVNQFLSPYTNLRTDEYGGSFENRMRFIDEIIVGIKKHCGQDFPVSVRLSVDEFVKGGIDLEMGLRIGAHLEKTGVDSLHASAGTYDSSEVIVESPLYEQGWRVYLAEEMKKAVSIPVITVGVIREPEFAESILADGKADFIAIGRGQIADPEWVHKVMEEREDELRKCICCMHCIRSVGKGLHVQCAINVRAGRELEFDQKLPQIQDKRHVVIVGGGPGGMEAARVLAEKGYRVTLFEKDNKLGGQLPLVSKPLHKEKMNWFIDYHRNELNRLGVEIHMNTEAEIGMIQAMNPYAVILATGAKGYMPDIPGINQPNVYGYEYVYSHHKYFNQEKIVVMGSGMICFSITDQLAAKGNDVTYIELPTAIGRRISPPTRARLMNRLKKNHVKIISDHRVSEIQPDAVVIEDPASGQQTSIDMDNVVIAMGTQAYNPLEESFRQHFDQVFVIGDAVNHPGSLSTAVKDAFELAYVLESQVCKKSPVRVH